MPFEEGSKNVVDSTSLGGEGEPAAVTLLTVSDEDDGSAAI